MPRLPGNRTRVPYQREARARIWQSMRVLRTFDEPSLIATAEATQANTRKYVQLLVRAGVLHIARPRRSGHKGGHTIYRLARDLGPYAPRCQSNGRVWDPNAHQVLGEDHE